MANSYSKVYLQIVFAVKYRRAQLEKPWRTEVFKYMSGIIKSKGHKAIIVNGVEDHVHIFIGMKSMMAVSSLVRDLKNNSTNFINRNNWVDGKFRWQKGHAVFSYSHSHVGNVYRYIERQEAHHTSQSFRKELLEFFRRYEIDYEAKYLFDFVDE